MRASRLVASLLATPLLPVAASLLGFLATWPDESAPTTFNGQSVPIPTYLTSDNFTSSTKKGYWAVEFFSPYCPHCQGFASTWKTLYEYYYTQHPTPQRGSGGKDDPGSFTNYYDFHFAKVDCVAQGDLCSQQGVRSFPSIRVYKTGEQIKELVGEKDMKTLSGVVEEVLESIHPGSRPQGELKLPKAWATEAVPVPAAEPTQVQDRSPSKDGRSDPLVATRIEAGPSIEPNPIGKSIELTAESFQRLVTLTRDAWFIKFYAPWCKHCQAMKPNWQGMARQMQGRLNVGEVNCDHEKRLCKDVKARGYPTILFFRGGERVEYDGLRGLGDLSSYAQKAVTITSGVPDVDAEAFEQMEKDHEVIFIYFYDLATTSEDFAALERLPMRLINRATLVKTSDLALVARFKVTTWPRLVVSREGKASFYGGLSPREMRDNRRVLGWMQNNWLPIVPELTASNAREIMDGKLVVLGILSRDRPVEFTRARNEIKTAAFEWIDKQATALKLGIDELRYAKQLRIEEAEDRNDQRALGSARRLHIDKNDVEHKDVRFAWVDGVFWERWIKTTFGISMAGGEKVVVNDEDHQRYWDVTMTGNPIVPSRTSILETLPRIVANPPKIAPKSKLTALGHVWWVLKNRMRDHPRISGVLGGICVITFLLWSRRMWWRSSDRGYGYFRVGEKGGPMDGLLGADNVSMSKKD